jgi:hypothetical protein
MNLQQIHDIASDALAEEELQYTTAHDEAIKTQW